MRLFILSDPACIHTRRWVTALALQGIDIFLFGLNKTDLSYYSGYKNVEVFMLDMVSGLTDTHKNGACEKLKYLTTLRHLKRKIKEFKPDVLHAHYASSYGFLGALSGFHPYIISVWGSDVYDFPRVSLLHRQLLKFNFSKADYILSTSNVMAKETQKYTNKSIGITPFGVDLELFQKMDYIHNNQFIIGNIKTLLPKYGIDILIKAFKRVLDRNLNRDIVLKIIGEGEERENLIQLCKKLNVSRKVEFLGRIDNNLLINYYNMFSVAVFTSVLNSESFGVVAVEAMACECPVVVSDADGFTEVVVNGVTGVIVPKRDVEATAEAIQKFLDDASLREEMGRMGRMRVEKLYDWKQNVKSMVMIYEDILQKKKGLS